MSLVPGARLGPYEVIASAGAGGMGEVWKARDTRLERSVAIKVLPAEFAQNAQLRLRFEREAKSISQLNHPHICTLYDVGNENGVEYLVLEYIEGETLADRLQKGPLPLDQVLRYGIEIADALDRAHKAGIVHRDLKPGNIMLTKSGAKLLDFGLAKPAIVASSVVTPEDATVAAMVGSRRSANGGPLTEEGTIVGTIQYMAPEQIEGKDADARTDIFAFGAVLYEMTTGKRAFDGKSKASLIASILATEPQPVSAVQPVTPVAFDRVVRTCLRKDPDARWQSAHDIAEELRWISEGAAGQPETRRQRALIPWLVSAALFVIAVGLAALWYRATSVVPRRIEMDIVPPPGTEALFPYTFAALSPDGRALAMDVRTGDGRWQLWIRRLDSGEMRMIAETTAITPFWSPDGRNLGFFSSGRLKRIDVATGSIEMICDAPNARGGTWFPDGTIVFAPTENDPLYRVPASGGKPVP